MWIHRKKVHVLNAKQMNKQLCSGQICSECTKDVDSVNICRLFMHYLHTVDCAEVTFAKPNTVARFFTY